MTQAAAAGRLRLVAIEWVRIQLTIRLRPVGGAVTELDASVALVQLESPARMPATRVRWEDGDLVARFNVMQGPGQMPLTPGAWRLDAEVDDPEGLLASQTPTMFPTPRGSYRVSARHADGRHLELQVDLDSPAGRSPASGRRFARRLARAGLRGSIAVLRRLLAGRRPAILFMSSTRPALGGNLKAVHDRMVERGLDRDADFIFSFKADLHAPTPWRERLRTPWLLARPAVVVLDDVHPLAARIADPKVPIVQLWHASGVVKTILYSRVGKPGGPDPWSRDYKQFTAAIVSSEHDVPHFAEAFGIPEERVKPTGIPRMDRFFVDRARADGREAALAAFPQARGRRVILFAPTFRGAGRTKSYDLEALDYPALHALCVEKDAVLIIRLHPRMHRSLDIPAELSDRLLDGTDAATDAPDILFATDLLITDYSSIIFEFATLGRPMLFFAPDLDEYRESVDLYEPYEELVPGRVVRTLAELMDAIRRDDYQESRLAPFVARHIAHLDGNATDRVIDQLILPGVRRA
ncbi:MAG: CDP-glycerol glycerophosphotransferase family protein [Candidatus Limnocylindrales bacterium]